MFGQAVGLVVIAFGAAVSFALAEDVEGTADVVSVADSAFAALGVELVVVAQHKGTVWSPAALSAVSAGFL